MLLVWVERIFTHPDQVLHVWLQTMRTMRSFWFRKFSRIFPDHNDAEPPHVPTEDPIDRSNDELETLVPTIRTDRTTW